MKSPLLRWMPVLALAVFAWMPASAGAAGVGWGWWPAGLAPSREVALRSAKLGAVVQEEAEAGDEEGELAELPEDTWDAIFLAGQRVGHSHTHMEYIEEEGETRVRVEMTERMEIRRFGATLVTELELTSFETTDGELLRFESQMQGGFYDEAEGEVVGDELQIRVTRAGEVDERTIAWDDDVLGFSGQDQTLRDVELEPGDELSFRMLDPSLFQIVTTSMTAEEYEQTEVYGGIEMRLLRVSMESDALPGVVMQAWLNDEGDALKTHIDAVGGITMYRVTEEVATAPIDAQEIDFGVAATLVEIEGELPAGYATTEAEYRLTLENRDPVEVFASGPTQELESVDDRTALLTVRRIAPEDGVENPEPETEESLEEYVRPNALLQSGAEAVVAMAREGAGDETDPWQLALRLERFVHDRMFAQRGFSTAFASAAEVCENLEGDCTEHAVLLAALLRANEIPSRVAVGLVYVPPGFADADGAAFGYHMWTEAYIDGQWIPLDATLGRGGIGGSHIKLTDSSLADSSGLEAFLPVMSVLGRLEIEVVRAEEEDGEE